MKATFLALLILVFGMSACNKFDDIFDHHNPGKPGQPASFSSDVIQKWATLQVRLMKNGTGPNHGFGRHYAYTGVAVWESIAPGMPGSAQLKNEWNGLTGLPNAQGKKFYWPANANAALAAINRSFFPNANAMDKAAIDSLETALHEQFVTKASEPVLNNSVQFGKAVALAVYNWAETDGYKTVHPPYTIPVGDGLWRPATTGQLPATPYWGTNRTVLKNSIKNITVPAPPAFSAQPGSAFYNMVKEVYDVSKTLTPDQQAMANFWRDVPGVTTPGHWINIIQQVFAQKNASLAKAALTYALTGAAINDAAIAVFKLKYEHNLIRPISYIRDHIDAAWSPYLGTPAHPEYVSAHSSLSGSIAYILKAIYGNSGSFTDHTYDYLGYAPRTFNSYVAIAEEAGKSRLYAGIHYQFSIDKGLWHGQKIASNILDRCNVSGY